MQGPAEPIFLPFMCRLRVLEIYIDAPIGLGILSFLIRSLRDSLTSPATLEHLKFDIVFTGYDNNLAYYRFFNALHSNADVWSHLDSIITHPTGSRLQRVDINIKYKFRPGYDGDVTEPHTTECLKPLLDALPLLREKGILFVEATVSDY